MRLNLNKITKSLMRTKKLGLNMLIYYHFFHIILNKALLTCILVKVG
jgi:hypothetical protein